MAASANVLYEFGPFQLDPPERLLLCDGQPVSLTPKAFDLLLALVDHSGHLVEKEELLKTVWPGAFVEEGNLAVTISLLRKALNDDRGHHRYIETVSKRGYRFVAEVKRRDDSALAISPGNTSEIASLSPTLRHVGVTTRPPVRSLHRRKTFFVVLAAIAFMALISTTAFLIDRRNAPPTTAQFAAIHSVAILPFQTFGSNSPDRYLGLGMADAVITKLANTGKIIVRPTTAIQQYAGAGQSPQQVGREQAVDAVLEGRIQRDGDRVRMTVQLIRVEDGQQLWADTFDRRFTNIFALEDALSEMATQSLRLELTGEESRKFTKRPTEDPDAYDDYMKGCYFGNKRTESALKKGLDYFREAIKLDSNFAQAYVGVADSYATLGLYSVLRPEEAFTRAKDAAMRALQMDDSLPEAHAAMGFIHFYYDWDKSASGTEFQRALSENPHDAMAHSWYAESLAAKGQYSEAIAEAESALHDDPLSLIVSSNAGWTFALAGRYDQSTETLKKGIDIDPEFPRTHFRLAEVYEARGQYELAMPEFEKAVKLSGGDPYYEASKGHAYAVSGNSSKAHGILRELLWRAQRQYVPPYAIALIYAGLGDQDQAFHWLQSAVEDKSTSMVFLRTDPEMASLHSDPRFSHYSVLVDF
ncbi:MAG: winged helix-turn-helix domain-containing protein [Acidobacteria bacterium]|nr:winged helix-turn-helix domain-containing protein [Acidobacteriota bacterium]